MNEKINSKISIGKIGEQAAAELYEKHNFKILARNFYNHKGKMFGEIDFIAVKQNHLHFVEIKTRTNAQFGTGLEALTKFKQMRLIKAAKFFIQYVPRFQGFQPHFDLAAVELNGFDKSIRKITIHSDVIDDIV